MPSYLAPAAGWSVPPAQSTILPSSAFLTVTYNPATQPNPAIRYSDLYETLVTAALSLPEPLMFPGSSLDTFVNLLAPGLPISAEAVNAARGVLFYRPGNNPGLLATAEDTYFDLTYAFSALTAGTHSFFLGSNPPPVLLQAGASMAAFSYPAQRLTKVDSGTGLPYTRSSRSIPIRWANVAALLPSKSRLKPLMEAVYPTQEEFDLMQANTGFYGYNVRALQDAFNEMLYWGPGEVGDYRIPSAANEYQTSTQSLQRFEIPHSIIL